MVVVSEGICTSCLYQNHCSFNPRNEVLWQCNEYELANRPTLQVSLDGNENPVPVASKRKGLCEDCLIESMCTWHHDEAVIFHCEHYQ